MLRYLYPKLVAYELGGVQTSRAPTGRVYWLQFLYDSGTPSGSSFEDSSAFDSDWTDHTEGEEKSKAKLKLNYSDIETQERAIWFEWTSALQQDLLNLHGLSAEIEMIAAASEQIAREINRSWLDAALQAVTAVSATFGTIKPATWDSQEKWLTDGLSMTLGESCSYIAEKVYRNASWAVADARTAAMLATAGSFVKEPSPLEYGVGLVRSGTVNELALYTSAWFNANTVLFSYKPENWAAAQMVLLLYEPLYISPLDSTASTNTLARSVTSRVGFKAVRGEGIGSLSIVKGGQGISPFGT